MFDFVGLPNRIERLEFDWVRLVFCSVLFDWIGRDKAETRSRCDRRKNAAKTAGEGTWFARFFNGLVRF